jgi:putative transposase
MDFAGSCGGAPISIIRQYIEQQQTPNKASFARRDRIPDLKDGVSAQLG